MGGRDGAEVVQVYVKSLTNPDAPIKALKAFKRVEIKQGEKCKVTLTLTPDAFSYYNDKKDDLDVFTGDYQLLYGSSSRDEDLQALPIRVI
ncbi:fibronectin type III-like domain-contianing protein [Phocaeicola paurosaccharolyticus]|uniref:fibronectin type III-like domain-contianing protein n=1 Tax=Phocaeicola paurosaccharolyticus TaxID=732242 RepID=UPI000A678F69|nr:fibronectin type III-like domain-contianing protein [Phocaeicola paurosaccharolyticus]